MFVLLPCPEVLFYCLRSLTVFLCLGRVIPEFKEIKTGSRFGVSQSWGYPHCRPDPVIITNSEPETSEPKNGSFTCTSFPITFNAPTTPRSDTTSLGPTTHRCDGSQIRTGHRRDGLSGTSAEKTQKLEKWLDHGGLDVSEDSLTHESDPRGTAYWTTAGWPLHGFPHSMVALG